MALNQNTLAGQAAAGNVSATSAAQSANAAMGGLDIDQITNADIVAPLTGYPPSNVILVYTQFSSGDVISNNVYAETKGLWSNTSASLSTFYTASGLTDSQLDYYLKIQSSTSSCDDSTEFYIAYGNRFGYGETEAEGQPNDTPTRAIYKQYRQLLLTPEDEQFSFKTGSAFISSDNIYVINFNSKLIGDKVDPGNFELALAKLDGNLYPNGTYTSSAAIKVDSGSSKVITLIDDSRDSVDVSPSITTSTRVFNIVSGTIENGIYTASNEAYGLFYADYGVMVLNADKLNRELGFNVTSASYVNGNNNIKLLTAISGAAKPTNTRTETSSFFARKVDIKTNSYYYVRIRNYQYNYSTNPTYYTGSRAELVHRDFTYNPVSYITSIGLYNPNYELLAVAKLSKPLKKTFFDEYLITIKLEY
jgi:hypothetical protein